MNAKRMLPLLIALLLLLVPAGLVQADMAPSNIEVVINQMPLFEYTYLDAASGHVYVPAASLAKAISAGFQDDGKQVTFSGPASSVSVTPIRQGDQVLVPFRAVIEGLGGKVTWRAADNMAVAQITPLYQAQTYTVNLPGDYFQPMALTVGVGDTVNFVNKDTDVHTIVSLDDAPAKLELTLAGGAAQSYLFTKPGIYHYYCSVHAAFDAASGLVKSAKDTDQFPAAMEGWIFVTGKDMPLSNNPTVAMPGDQFTPEALMVKAGTTVTFANKDTDVHTIVTVPGSPADIQLALKGGDTQTYTFTKPGLYIYYCSVHAAYDSQTGLIKAARGTDQYPGAMMGVVAVVP